jgi:ABC-type branched-subunit amino acid transport system ATPase component
MQTAWRLAAWLTSAAAFAAHIWYELFRLRHSPLTTALHAALAAALGAFGLAVAANLHAHWTATGNQRLLAIALAVWPALTAGPAFVVALAVAAGLARMRRSD